MSSPACMVLHCTGSRSEPSHEVLTPEDGDGWLPRPVCAPHWGRIDSGEPWLWVPGRRLKGVGSTLWEGCILMDAELSGYGLVVDADVRMNSAELFSPDLLDGEPTPTLAIDGRIFRGCRAGRHRTRAHPGNGEATQGGAALSAPLTPPLPRVLRSCTLCTHLVHSARR